MALCALCMALARAIVVLVLFERSAKNPQQRSSHGKSVRCFGLSLPTSLFPPCLLSLKPQQHCLSLFPLHLLPNPLRSRSSGVIGHAAPSGVTGSSGFVHKLFFFLLRRFNRRRNRSPHRQRDTPEHNVHIGVSRGMSVSLAMHAARRLHS